MFKKDINVPDRATHVITYVVLILITVIVVVVVIVIIGLIVTRNTFYGKYNAVSNLIVILMTLNQHSSKSSIQSQRYGASRKPIVGFLPDLPCTVSNIVSLTVLEIFDAEGL